MKGGGEEARGERIERIEGWEEGVLSRCDKLGVSLFLAVFFTFFSISVITIPYG